MAGRFLVVVATNTLQTLMQGLFSPFYLKETLRPGDVAGLALVVCGVLPIVSGS